MSNTKENRPQLEMKNKKAIYKQKNNRKKKCILRLITKSHFTPLYKMNNKQNFTKKMIKEQRDVDTEENNKFGPVLSVRSCASSRMTTE